MACLAISVVLLVGYGDRLDADAVLPGFGGEQGSATLDSETADGTEGVWVVFVILLAVTAAPLVAPRAWFRRAAAGAAVLMGLFCLVTILRLGIVFVPVVVLLTQAVRSTATREQAPALPE